MKVRVWRPSELGRSGPMEPVEAWIETDPTRKIPRHRIEFWRACGWHDLERIPDDCIEEEDDA